MDARLGNKINIKLGVVNMSVTKTQEQFLEDILLSLEYSVNGKYRESVAQRHRVPLSAFHRPIMIDPDFHLRSYAQVIPPDATLKDLSMPLDFCSVQKPSDGDNDDIFQVNRFRQVSLKQVRGLVRVVATPIVQHSTLFMNRKHEFITFRMHYTRKSNGDWIRIDTDRFRQAGYDFYREVEFFPADERISDSQYLMLQTALGYQFTTEFDWHVAIGVKGGIHVLVPTDPKGAVEAFKDRDLPEGKKRRSSLVHWVSQHYRRAFKQSDDSEVVALVRSHLRGETRFTWAGFDCQIIPSASDVRIYERTFGRLPKHALGSGPR